MGDSVCIRTIWPLKVVPGFSGCHPFFIIFLKSDMTGEDIGRRWGGRLGGMDVPGEGELRRIECARDGVEVGRCSPVSRYTFGLAPLCDPSSWALELSHSAPPLW